MIIYKTTNLINGKIYIGLDTHNNPKYLGSGKLLHFAIEKYGISAFSKEIIDRGETIKELNEKEKYWISSFSATNRNIGYNLANGGWSDDDTARKISNALSGKKLSEETKIKISETIKQRFKSGKIVHWMLGKNHTQEWKNHISKLNSGKNNHMFGKNVNDVWIQKYGKEKANILREEKRIKASKSLSGDKNPTAKKVICLETKEIFTCIKFAQEWLKLIGKNGNIYQAIRKNFKAGGFTWKKLEE